MKENTAQVVAQVPVDVGDVPAQREAHRVHDDRDAIKVNVLLVPNRHLETPNYSSSACATTTSTRASRCRCRSTW